MTSDKQFLQNDTCPNCKACVVQVSGEGDKVSCIRCPSVFYRSPADVSRQIR